MKIIVRSTAKKPNGQTSGSKAYLVYLAKSAIYVKNSYLKTSSLIQDLDVN